MSIKEITKKMKLINPILASTSVEIRNNALESIINNLEKNKDKIFEANTKDLNNANVSNAIKKRLLFNEDKLNDVINGIKQLITLDDPLFKELLNRQLDNDLLLKKVTVPIGVIGVIFEARPDALVQISSLCIKSGNCAILKGGKETINTNKVLFEIINEAIIDAGLNEGVLALALAHEEIDELLECDKYVDLLIPRGSNEFVRYIMDHTKIPVMGHADGICSTYIDKDYDLNKLIPLIVDAKTQYTAACNATEVLLVHKDVAKEVLPLIKDALEKANVIINGSEEVNNIINVNVIDDFKVEYLDLEIAIKVVNNVEEAVMHINENGSHHTDAIISENKETIEYFTNRVDSAGVYVNASTRFADGFRYGFGAEVGISTSKIHARGPVGLEGLITYKYILNGNGNIVSDYASGQKTFKFKDF